MSTQAARFIFFVFIILCLVWVGPAVARKKITVQVINNFHESREIRVMDRICRKTVFSNVIEGGSRTTVRLCADQMNQGSVEVHDLDTGNKKTYGGITQGGNIHVWGSGPGETRPAYKVFKIDPNQPK